MRYSHSEGDFGVCLAIQAQVWFIEIGFHTKCHDSLSNSEIEEKLWKEISNYVKSDPS